MQVHNTSVQVKKAERSWPGVTLIAQNGNSKDGTVITFYENATNGLDSGLDAGKRSASLFQLYTKTVSDNHDLNLAIQTLPDNQYDQLRIPVGIDCPDGEKVVFRAAGVILPDGVYPVLEDKMLNMLTPLKSINDSCVVNLLQNSSGVGRFFLRFGDLTSVKTVKEPQIKYSAWFADRKIVISGTGVQDANIVLYDMNGRKLGDYPMLKENRNEIPADGLTYGVYLLQINGSKGNQVIKVPVFHK